MGNPMTDWCATCNADISGDCDRPNCIWNPDNESPAYKRVLDAMAYSQLEDILGEALAQASSGKGFERHSKGELWEDQRWHRVAKDHGLGYLTGQAAKKIGEQYGYEDPERRVQEILGAINYLAMAIYKIREDAA